MLTRILYLFLVLACLFSASRAIAVDTLPLMMVPIMSATSGIDGSSVVAVDPYITGAQFYEDKNNNGIKDAGEQSSTTTNAAGLCSFPDKLTPGSTIVASVAGVHNGNTFVFTLKRKVKAGMNGTIYISPSTSLAALGLTDQEVQTMLTVGGANGLTDDMVIQDPMTGIATAGSSITDAALCRLRASLVSYIFMRIREGSNTLKNYTPAQLYALSQGDIATEPVAVIFNTVGIIVDACLSSSVLTAAQSGIPAGAPAVDLLDVVQTAVTIADRLAEAGYTACNDAGGDPMAGISAVMTTYETYIQNAPAGDTWIDKLSMRYYGFRNKVALSALPPEAAIPANVSAGANSVNGVWYINTSNNIIEGSQ